MAGILTLVFLGISVINLLAASWNISCINNRNRNPVGPFFIPDSWMTRLERWWKSL